MKNISKISDSEWRVMQVFWSNGDLTAEEVVEELKGKTKWSPHTIKTLINRLLYKKALRFEEEGRKYRYFPAVSREKCVKQERFSFLHRVYEGTSRSMLAAFIEDAKLSREDIEELKKILDKKGGNE
jgi:BlaI family penicillinase repressor